jgi:hypothetical protein
MIRVDLHKDGLYIERLADTTISSPKVLFVVIAESSIDRSMYDTSTTLFRCYIYEVR